MDLKQNPEIGGRKLNILLKFFSMHLSGPSPLLAKGQANLLKILLSSALKTDSEFIFLQIFCHANCSIAHIQLIAEIS